MFLKRTLLTSTFLAVITFTSYSQFFTGNDRLVHVVTSDFKRVGAYDITLLSSNSILFKSLPATSISSIYLTRNYFLTDLAITDNSKISVGFDLFRSSYGPSTRKFGVGPVTLAFKFGNLAFMDEKLVTGFLIGGSFDIKGLKNVPYYPYNSGSLEFGVMNYWSYYFDSKISDQSESIHLNLMMYSHGDKGLDLSNSVTTPLVSKDRTISLKYGLGYKVPYGQLTFIAETWGELFFRNPPSAIYSRESFNYLTAGVKYDFQWVRLGSSLDLLVLGYGDNTDYAGGVQYGYGNITGSDETNYTPYYLNVSASFPLSNLVDKWLGNAPPEYFFSTTEPKNYTENLRKEDVITMIEYKYYNTLYECYKSALRFDEKMKGTVYFDFSIDTKGNVDKAKVIISTFDSVYSNQVEECMLEKMKSWTFPEGSAPIRFEILPLNFGGGN